MLREISLGYDAAEDRIQLRMRTRDGDVESSHRLLLTRRLCLPFRDGLQDLVRRSAQVPETLSAPARQALQQGHHQATLQQTKIERERREPAEAGGAPPRLVLRALCGTRRGDSQPVLRFECQTGEPLTLALSERTLHALAASLDDRMRSAAWLSGPPAPAAAASPSDKPPAGLH